MNQLTHQLNIVVLKKIRIVQNILLNVPFSLQIYIKAIFYTA